MSLQVLATVYDRQASVVSSGPFVKSLKSSVIGDTVTVDLVFDRADSLHTRGTGDCAITAFSKNAIPGDHRCCAESPFQIGTSRGDWIRANFTISGNSVTLNAVVPATQGAPSDLRFSHENFPQCALYNGKGGPDDHSGVAAAPFRMSLFTDCPAATVACLGAMEALPSGQQCCTSSVAANETCIPNAGCYKAISKP